MKISHLLSGLALAALVSGTALAQAPAAPAGSAPSGQPEVKTIGDWAVRCYPMQSASPCDMFQQQNDAKSQQRILALSIAYIPHLDRHAIQISVPLGVAVAPGVVIHTGTFSSPAMPYRRCDRGGCYVEMLIDNATVDQLSHGGDSAMVKITADDGKNYDLKVSLNGFAAAHDQMAELAKQKAKAPPPAAAAPAAPAAPGK
jgi:invasion protein IalB